MFTTSKPLPNPFLYIILIPSTCLLLALSFLLPQINPPLSPFLHLYKVSKKALISTIKTQVFKDLWHDPIHTVRDIRLIISYIRWVKSLLPLVTTTKTLVLQFRQYFQLKKHRQRGEIDVEDKCVKIEHDARLARKLQFLFRFKKLRRRLAFADLEPLHLHLDADPDADTDPDAAAKIDPIVKQRRRKIVRRVSMAMVTLSSDAAHSRANTPAPESESESDNEIDNEIDNDSDSSEEMCERDDTKDLAFGRLLIRPHSKFCIRWRLLVSLVAILEISRVLSHHLFLASNNKSTFQSFVTMHFVDAQCLAPLHSKRRFFGFFPPPKFFPPSWCDSDSGGLSVDHAEVLGGLLQTFVFGVASADVVVNFFVGKIDKKTLVIRSKGFFNRWVLGVLFSMLLHPGWKWCGRLFVRGLDELGLLRFGIGVVVLAWNELKIRRLVGRRVRMMRRLIHNNPALFNRNVDLYLFEKTDKQLLRKRAQ
ncbi:hypothetical protein ScalyP_jg11926 [Parmales sp. scaly parma]|nr:hypothetical protein ScalyP_jg11926 [Parmales sp. scaly parma]